MRRAPVVACIAAACVGACGGGGESAPKPTYVALGGEVASVGDTPVGATLVADVALARGASGSVALDAVVDDALAAQGARAEGLDRSPAVRWASTAALGRDVPRRIWADARLQGAPTDDELAQVEVVHAVVLRTRSTTEARAVFTARAVADAVAAARTSDEFLARAQEATRGVRASVEALPPFDAAGRTQDGMQLDPDFTAAAFALHTPGETSPIVESPFGWHVIRLVSRVRPPDAELEKRRSDLAEDVLGLRARAAPGPAPPRSPRSNPGRGVRGGRRADGSGGGGAMSARARPLAAARDQHESAFATILADLVRRVPGARGAALVDRDGETVDYSGRLDPFAMRLAAAHWRIVLDELRAQRFFRSVRWLALRARRTSYLVHELPDRLCPGGRPGPPQAASSAGGAPWPCAPASSARRPAGAGAAPTGFPPR